MSPSQCHLCAGTETDSVFEVRKGRSGDPLCQVLLKRSSRSSMRRWRLHHLSSFRWNKTGGDQQGGSDGDMWKIEGRQRCYVYESRCVGAWKCSLMPFSFYTQPQWIFSYTSECRYALKHRLHGTVYFYFFFHRIVHIVSYLGNSSQQCVFI